MAWLGIITLITIYWCVFTSATSGRLGWIAICIWLIPILAMTITYEGDISINGLMVIICILMFWVCRRGLVDVKMWNTKVRKRHSIIFAMVYIIVFIMFLYSFAQAQLYGYILNVQGWKSDHGSVWTMLLTITPMLALNWIFTQMVFTAMDRLYCKKKELTLLSCQFYIASESGVEKGIGKGYFLEGIQNGITYHFRMTRRTYFMLQQESILNLKAKIGVFGGLYITQLDAAEFLKRIRRTDRRDAKLGIFGCILVTAFGVWLFLV
ncbi:hypothetical protein CLNEO_05090 [Anaerotignum neopropionicum]|uniref:Uncharacterized protein n=1 Tax=Anaerotignum neopropionicum TaxID=36847 RepID=A0A136WIY7_9FIRM|nr:hypothetical protein [Anaerotignum neopropionicum]KXL54278.1 hypothetical protein CLNEO_03800 [Anaerotignum neopropionicum]KXL54403.1 hypothetical protein CLNEO_05090 [Anaerotignum neopropionicum]